MRGLRLSFLLLAAIALFPALTEATEPAPSAPGSSTCLEQKAKLESVGLLPFSPEPMTEAICSALREAPRAAGLTYGCTFPRGYCWADCSPCQCDSECPFGIGCWSEPLC